MLQACLTLCNPMDCSPPGSSCPWDYPRQEYWSGLPFPAPEDLPNPGIEPASLISPALTGGFLTASATGVSPSVSIFSSFYKDTSPIDLSLTWPFHLQRPYFQIRSQSLLPEVRITSSFRRHKSSMIPFTSVSSTPSTGPGKQTEMGSRASQFQL